jgi:hypothetical protein
MPEGHKSWCSLHKAQASAPSPAQSLILGAAFVALILAGLGRAVEIEIFPSASRAARGAIGRKGVPLRKGPKRQQD